MFDKHFAGLNLTSAEDHGIQRPISRVTLLLDDENAVTAGDDTGMELTASCPHATQAMANAILAQAKGYCYQMFSAGDVNLDPAAELGDGITAGGIYSVISRISDDGSGYPSVTAPGEAELEDEYPAGGPMTQEFNRKIAQTRSRITKTAEQIRLEVYNEISGLSSSITVELDNITSTVKGLSGQFSSIKQYVDNITLEVSNGSTSSTITLKSGSTTISSKQINMNGLVTFTGLANGTTTIDGACIKTGTIDASRINLSNYDTSAQTNQKITSSIQALQNGLSLQVSNGDTSSTITLTSNGVLLASQNITFNGIVTFNTLSGAAGTVINGAAINTSTLHLDTLYGEIIYLRDNAGNVGASFDISTAATADSACNFDTRSMRLRAWNGDVYIYSRYGSIILEASSAVRSSGNLIPNANNIYTLGSYGFQWNDIYATNSHITSSDQAGKKDIDYDMRRYSALFDALRPCSFRRKDGQSGRVHTGLIAQEVAEARDAAGLDAASLAAYCAWGDSATDGTDAGCGLRYEEFIALLIYEVQELKKQIRNLKGGPQ